MAQDPGLPTHPMRRNGDVPLAGSRSQAIQRLQIGLSGLAAMILLIGLASAIRDRADQSDAEAVPEAAPTTAIPTATPKAGSDPLADVGVVPDLPPAPTPAASNPALQDDAPPPAP